MSFFREGDVQRLRQLKALNEQTENPFSQKILAVLDNPKLKDEDRRWISLAWCQFMYWFADVEKRIGRGMDVDPLLEQAEQGWLDLKASKFLPEEMQNNGTWLRAWRRALQAYRQ